MMVHIIEGVGYFEETECCDSFQEHNELPFKFKYLFSKDPCEKCLVRAACTHLCEPKYAKRDQVRSIKVMKVKLRRRFSKFLDISFISFWVAIVLLTIILWASGCKQVNHKQANQYYEQEVKNFPEENK